MTTEEWNWKNKDGSKPGLLYESGNWGDLLKILWLDALVQWKATTTRHVNYFDPFAGDVSYPLGKKARHRLYLSRLDSFDFIKPGFVAQGLWPSSASAARLLVSGKAVVWDADPGRRGNWRIQPGFEVASGDCGWEILAEQPDDPDAVWLVDPYDFLAEWRERLPLLLEKARQSSTLLYLYNRSGRNEAAFKEYRVFKNALEDARGDLPKRLGRIAADAFLPRCHHELMFLPSEKDCHSAGMDQLFDRLCLHAECLDAGLRRVGVCDI